jgi:hypothetical protein
MRWVKWDREGTDVAYTLAIHQGKGGQEWRPPSPTTLSCSLLWAHL